ncbi:hypothetical protein OZ411_22340 [Bradyrhizobium sp. Arg237L]|uniref:DUF6538 domain-containing protein n=1 Tax=Bradyrhizobium sp. Arg237L TaxID=3003352 RepID=UPI00249F2F4C|nr:DUF6538 domain-containing protein [Bradyrhizobium sp. Arg237L]MDI4235551.1 hypothetical protein [Bradyrhizobium sp. Arg237L]
MAFHIFRRDAVYYWRRRVPRALASLLDRPHLLMSLKTTSHVVARRLAAQLDLILEDAAMLADSDDPNLTRSQIETMLHGVVDRHLTKLERVALAAKGVPGFQVDQALMDDKRAFWAYALLDAQGVSAVVRAEDRVCMAADGLSEADIGAVQNHLTMLRINELVPPKEQILRRMIEGVGARPTAMNINVAQGTYFRGMKLALAETDRRYGGRRVEDEAFVDRMLLWKDPREQVSLSAVDSDLCHRGPPNTESDPVVPSIAMADFVSLAEDVIQQNARDGHWDDKTQRQARSLSKLFVKFMLHDQKVVDLNSLRQSHVGKFVDFLRSEIYVHYGKSVRDEDLTIAELREKALTVNKNKRGIGGDTLNRHLTFLGQMFRHAIARGAEALAEIELAALRAKGKKKRARDARAKLPLDQAAAIFRTPPFNNCAAWDALAEQGPDGPQQVFHCALYFVPILIYYTGCRREELCGAMVDDVILDHGEIPYIHIAKNEQRRIKNSQSQRNVPLHPEVFRLNFVAYVKAIRALGYKLLFPDLYSPSSASPLGDRFYKEFKPTLIAAGATEEGLGAHAVRHLFGRNSRRNW